ncbi:ABC transporter ATP-binding protein [Streptomyces sp. TLI_185]|uniref:ABC transporter ATP-binding protein n=1 Tax=Streptomyces sp. TLI_185 TaxID=2485151 RepID=UPI0037D9F013
MALGRAPHHGLLGRDGPEDHGALSDAIDRCGVRPFADRDYASPTGGERQRVLHARALAQEPELLVLDELTNHLDIRAWFELLDLIRATGVTTLAVLHDLDLAARLCDHLVVLRDGGVAAAGPVLEVLTPDLLAAVFGVRARTEQHGRRRVICSPLGVLCAHRSPAEARLARVVATARQRPSHSSQIPPDGFGGSPQAGYACV